MNLEMLFLFPIMKCENEKRKDGMYNDYCILVYLVFIVNNEKTKIGTYR